MNNSGNSLFFPNSLEFSRPSLEEYAQHLPLTSQTSLLNTIDCPAPENQRFNLGVESSNVDSGIVEVSHTKPQGRLRGTKNKSEASPENKLPMKVVVLEIPPRADVIQWVENFANSKQLCVTIFNGFGSISCVDVRNDASEFQPTRIVGPFTLISLSGTFLCSSPLTASSSSSSSSSLPSTNSFSASLARFDGKLFGVVPSKLVSMTPVLLTLTTFSKPKIYNEF